MKVNKPSSFEMTSYEKLFKNAGIALSISDRQVVDIPIHELHEFKGHTYRVIDDESMQELVNSIKEQGILTPGICRVRAEGGYEIISGHRRVHAAGLAGKKAIPMIVVDYSDDEAIEIMVDSNLQREELLPSERAKSYRAKYEAAKRQKKKNVVGTMEDIGSKTGESVKQVQRYIWLSRLLDKLLYMVDDKKLGLVQGVAISFLNPEEQGWVADYLSQNKVTVSAARSTKLKELSQKGILTEAKVYEMLAEKRETVKKFSMDADKLEQYFDPGYSQKQIEEVILKLLEDWKKEGGTGK